MNKQWRRLSRGLLLVQSALVLGLASGGCSSTPPRVAAPGLHPAKIAAAAMEEYDANKDGALAGEELTSAAAINSALSFYDTSGDGKVDSAEIQNRIQSIAVTKVGLMPFYCRASLNGQPLAGATVTLRPEPFLQDSLLVASGMTDDKGRSQPAIADDLLPAADRGLQAVQPGLYRVEITHPTISLPVRYNTNTTLGREISGDSLVGVDVHFALQNN
ncbi:hypothetical protein ETAA8_64510 [Anatilimnocola aggregata]|uniref:EF-hand domain-containing protein n=1 Tax=Anatilimnocola aggregata TaxID=2528021 RepID=A0A517YM43_9BACT|nr:hypothetical protein [Anatilimnocola aggregata]QDU31298.1 hypothetical protein ETAA8_64510 [Anatilimnocola aggregata]